MSSSSNGVVIIPFLVLRVPNFFGVVVACPECQSVDLIWFTQVFEVWNCSSSEGPQPCCFQGVLGPFVRCKRCGLFHVLGMDQCGFFFSVGFCLEFWGDLLKVCWLPLFLRALTYFRWSNGVLGLNENGRFPSLISFSSLSSPLWGLLGFCYPAGAVSHHVV